MSYESYSHYNMKPKSDLLGKSYVNGTSSYNHENWLGKTVEASWKKVMDRYSDTMQMTILRAMAVAGVEKYRWNDVFNGLYNGTGKYQTVHRNWLEYQSTPSMRELVQLMTGEYWYSIYYPVHCPVLLLAYEYTQNDYLYDLYDYWTNIDDAYHTLWDNARIGVDSPAVAQMRRIGKEAIREMDRVSGAANQAHNRF